jgi:hypothetical protein
MFQWRRQLINLQHNITLHLTLHSAIHAHQAQVLAALFRAGELGILSLARGVTACDT